METVTDEYPQGLSYDDLAKRHNVDEVSMRSALRYARQQRDKGRPSPNLLPEPDMPINGRTPRWSLPAIEAWEAARVPSGTRTDIPRVVLSDVLVAAVESVYDSWWAGRARIDWHDFLDRVEDMADVDLGDDMLSPTIKAIKVYVRTLRDGDR